jgi:Ca-activated chloride channel homolog
VNTADTIQFELPALLWTALLAVPCLLVFFVWAWRRKQAAMARFIPARLFDILLVGYSARREKVRYGLLGAAVVFGLLALAQPRWGYTWEEVRQRGLDVVVAVDTSRSMLAPDLPPTRLERARLACIDLMRVAHTDRLGLVAFAGSAFLQCPLTFDSEAFRLSLSALDTGIIPQGGSSLAGAIQTATESFKKDEDNHKVLILLTDGEDHEEGAVEAAKEAAKAGMKIFTIGVGTPKGELLSFKDEQGKQEYVRDAEGNIVRSKLNEELLREIATVAGGFYLPLTGTKTMETLYAQGLASLPKSESEGKMVQRFQERFQWPLAIVILLLAIEWLLQGQPAPVVKKAAVVHPVSRPAVATTVALLLICLSVASVSASPAQARKAFEAGEYRAALEEYQRLLKERPDPRLHYNAGTAAYRAEDYETAVNQFNEALRTPDLDLQRDAYYNRANTRYRQGEKITEMGDKQQMWESSLNDYDRALKLRPEDQDAKFNRDLVQKKLEELKKQQEQQKQQQQKSGDDKEDKKENQDDKDKQQQDQQKQNNEQGKDQQDKQKQNGDQKDQQKSPGDQDDKQKQEQGKKPDESKGDESGKDDKQRADQQGKKKGDDKKDGKQPEPGEGGEPMMAQGTGEMTQQQAMQLLDALKSQEKALIFQPPSDGKPKPRIFKDW